MMRAPALAFFILLSSHAPAQMYPGNYTGLDRRDGQAGTFIVHSDSSTIQLTFYGPGVLRVDLLSQRDSIPDSSFAVVAHPETSPPVTVEDEDSSLTVSSTSLRVRIEKYPLRFTFLDSTGGKFLAEPASGGLGWSGARRLARFELSPAMHFYGTGERGIGLDLRGERLESYNRQIGGYTGPLPTMNVNVPFTATSAGFGLFVDNTWRGVWDFGSADSAVFSYEADGGTMSLYIIVAPTIAGQLEKYTWLTGRQPLPPRWALGFIQSKNRYENEDDARAIVRTMREKQIPCDALVLDLGWFEHMGDISWNEKAWPHHDQMVSDFLARGMKTILITEPYIVEPSLNFHEAAQRGFLASDSSGRAFMLEHWWSCRGGCSAALLDLTNPETREWWWSRHPAAFGDQVAGIWTDLGEPERHPDGMHHALGPAVKIHNIYNLLWAQLVFDGFNRLHPDRRVMNLTRSGFAGIQRYGVIPWSGDVGRSFGGLAVQLPMLLNMGMSGLAYHNSDIGGYARMETTPELYVRWMQYGTFCPITRAHGAGESVHGYPTEPWRFGEEAERICRDYIRLRYRLLPYIYSMAHQNYVSGLPLARPLFWLDPADSSLSGESSSYMWGDAFLVSPVVRAGETEHELYLPRGTWINYWTDEVMEGGRDVTVASPLDRMPLFVKGGSIIPMGPVMEYSDQRTIDTMTVLVYPSGRSKATYVLYEDDGTSLGYQRGEYAETVVGQWWTGDGTEQDLTVQVAPTNGTFEGLLPARVYRFEIHGVKRAPTGVANEGGTALRSRYDSMRDVLVVETHIRTDMGETITVTLPPGAFR